MCDTLINELSALVGQVGGNCPQPCGGCAPQCCSPPPAFVFPFAQVTMSVPPPIMPPTRPQPVEPLRMPNPCMRRMTENEAMASRYSNFYNGYNLDYHNDGTWFQGPPNDCCDDRRGRKEGTTVDGKSTCCPRCPPCIPAKMKPGCPTGFKPCTMKLTPPCGCDAFLPWCAEIQPCPKQNACLPYICCDPC